MDTISKLIYDTAAIWKSTYLWLKIPQKKKISIFNFKMQKEKMKINFCFWGDFFWNYKLGSQI